MLEIFNRHRGDAVVIPGRGGRFWVEDERATQSRPAPRATRPWVGTLPSRWAWPSPCPDQRVVLFDSEGDVLMGIGRSAHRRREGRRPTSTISCWTMACMPPPAGSRCPTLSSHGIRRGRPGLRLPPPPTAIDNLEDFASQIEEILSAARPGVRRPGKSTPKSSTSPSTRVPQWQRKTRNQAVADMKAELGIGD